MEKTIIQKLFDGEIYPAEEILPRHPEYRKICNEYDEYREKTGTFLGKKEFDQMELLRLKVHDMDMKETFAYGLRLGLFLMMELLETKDKS